MLMSAIFVIIMNCVKCLIAIRIFQMKPRRKLVKIRLLAISIGKKAGEIYVTVWYWCGNCYVGRIIVYYFSL